MKINLTILVALFLTSPLPAEFLQIHSLEEIERYIKEDTLVLLDLDQTVYYIEEHFGSPEWFYLQIDQGLQNGDTDRNSVIFDFYPTYLKAQKVCPGALIDPSTPSFIMRLQKQSVPIMGLTHRQPCLSVTTIKQLDSMGIDFRKNLPFSRSFQLEHPYSPTFFHGVLFVADYNDKGEVFMLFFDRLEKKPKRILFVDDKLHNLESLQRALPRSIEYIGMHFLFHPSVENPLHQEAAKIQQKMLGKILSDGQAKILLENE